MNTTLTDGKSVTATNKQLLSKAKEELRRATRALCALASAPTACPPALDEPKKEIVSCVNEEIASFKKIVTANTHLSYAQDAISPMAPDIQ